MIGHSLVEQDSTLKSRLHTMYTDYGNFIVLSVEDDSLVPDSIWISVCRSFLVNYDNHHKLRKHSNDEIKHANSNKLFHNLINRINNCNSKIEEIIDVMGHDNS